MSDLRGALFSEDRRFRYVWWDIWEEALGYLNLLMLNPSTADEFKSDPTVTRVRERAIKMGFGGLKVTNAYAFRATDPKELKKAKHPIGPDNDMYIVTVASMSKMVICGWGANIQQHRARDLLCLLRFKARKVPHALVFTKGGQPGHPLYLPYEGCEPMPITSPNFCMGCGFEIAPISHLCGECACEDDIE